MPGLYAYWDSQIDTQVHIYKSSLCYGHLRLKKILSCQAKTWDSTTILKRVPQIGSANICNFNAICVLYTRTWKTCNKNLHNIMTYIYTQLSHFLFQNKPKQESVYSWHNNNIVICKAFITMYIVNVAYKWCTYLVYYVLLILTQK